MQKRIAIALAFFVAVCAEAQTDVCRYIPGGGDAQSLPVDSVDNQIGIYGKCVSLFEQGQASIFLYKSPEMARAQIEQHAKFSETDHMGSPEDPNPRSQSLSGLGDVAVEVIKDQVPPGDSDSPVRYNNAFSRGCYMVFVNAGGALGMSFVSAGREGEWNAKKDWVRSTAATIDQNLQGAPCPDGGGPPPPPPPGTLGVTVNCQTNFDQADLVVCTAQPQNQKADAILTYDWAFNGEQQSIRGSELTRTGVQPGSHTVNVLVSDSVNQLVSAPASVTFTKQPPGSSGGGGGGSGGGGPPIVPIIIITTVVAGGIGTGIAIARGRKPRPTPLTPRGVTPFGDAPREPQATRPTAPPEQLAPLNPPAAAPPPAPPEQLKPRAKPPAPPERVAKPAPPPQPSQDDQRNEGDLWLEAGNTEVTVRADGKQEVIITVRACQLTGGVVTDASADVFPTKDATHPKKIHLTNQPGYCAFGVRGTHAGATPITGKITVSGTSPTGRRVRPAEITVHLEPVKIDVKIKVWKTGFRFQEVTATLPGMCKEVRGKAQGGEGPIVGRGDLFINAMRGQNVDASGALAKAHCTASLNVGDGAWSNPVEVRTNDQGTFFFGLPPRLIQVYGDDLGSYDLPNTFQLGLNDEVKAALTGYRTALADFQRDLAYNPTGNDYATPVRHCADYPTEFLDQLRKNDEEQYLRSISAIQRLRCALLFALKYRKDLHAQRRILDYAANEALGSVVDVVTDFIPMAMGIFQWLGGKGISKVIGGTTYVFPGFPGLMLDLANTLRRIPGMWYAAKAMLIFVRFLKAPVKALEKSVAWLLNMAMDMAQAAGLNTQYLRDVARLGENANEIPIGRIFDDASNPIAEIASVFAQSSHSLVRSTLRFAVGVMHAFIIAIASVLKAVGFFIRNMPWGAEGGWAATLGEVIEDILGKVAGKIYDNFGYIVDRLITGAELVAAEPSKLSSKNAADVVMDAIVSMKDFDARCAPELQHAYETSHDLGIEEDWEVAVHKVSKQELAVMARLEKATEAVSFMDRAAPVAKLAVKIVQMVMFAWGTLAEAAIKIAGKAAEKVGSSIPYLKDFVEFLKKSTGKDALSFASRFETYIDVCELIVVRGPIIIKEIVTLISIYCLGPTRIKAVYDK